MRSRPVEPARCRLAAIAPFKSSNSSAVLGILRSRSNFDMLRTWRSNHWHAAVARMSACRSHAEGRHPYPVVRPGFKPGRGRQPLPGRFDSCCLPPQGLRSSHAYGAGNPHSDRTVRGDRGIVLPAACPVRAVAADPRSVSQAAHSPDIRPLRRCAMRRGFTAAACACQAVFPDVTGAIAYTQRKPNFATGRGDRPFHVFLDSSYSARTCAENSRILVASREYRRIMRDSTLATDEWALESMATMIVTKCSKRTKQPLRRAFV